MSSIDEEELRAFYQEHLAPAAQRLRARQRTFFALGPDDAPSWYTPPVEGDELATLEPQDFENSLRRLWRDDPELHALVGPLVDLSRRLEHKQEDADDVSPFIYVMF